MCRAAVLENESIPCNQSFSVFIWVSGDHKQKFYWGHKEILLPVYKNMADAMKKHPEVDVLISFASLRSAFDSTMETMNYPQVNKITTGILLDFSLVG